MFIVYRPLRHTLWAHICPEFGGRLLSSCVVFVKNSQNFRNYFRKVMYFLNKAPMVIEEYVFFFDWNVAIIKKVELLLNHFSIMWCFFQIKTSFLLTLTVYLSMKASASSGKASCSLKYSNFLLITFCASELGPTMLFPSSFDFFSYSFWYLILLK